MNALLDTIISADINFYDPIVTTFNGTKMIFATGIFELYVPRLSAGNTMTNCYDYVLDFDGHVIGSNTESSNVVKFFVGHLFNAHMIFFKDRPDHFESYRIVDCLTMYKFIDLYVVPHEHVKSYVSRYVDALKKRVLITLSFYVLGPDICYHGPITTIDPEFAQELSIIAERIVINAKLNNILTVTGLSRMLTYMHFVRGLKIVCGEYDKYNEIYSVVRKHVEHYGIFRLDYSCAEFETNDKELQNNDTTELYYFLERMGVNKTAVMSWNNTEQANNVVIDHDYFAINVIGALLRMTDLQEDEYDWICKLWYHISPQEKSISGPAKICTADFDTGVYRFFAHKYHSDRMAEGRIVNIYNNHEPQKYGLPIAVTGSNHNRHNYIGNDEHAHKFDVKFTTYKKICGSFYDVELPDTHEYDCNKTDSDSDSYDCVQEDISDFEEDAED